MTIKVSNSAINEFNEKFSLDKKGSYVEVINKETKSRLGLILLEGNYMEYLKSKNGSVEGLFPFIKNLERLKEKIPEKDMKMLYGKEFHESVKTCNKILEQLKKSKNQSKLLDYIKYEVNYVGEKDNGLFFYKVKLNYKGKQWTAPLYSFIKERDWELFSILTQLFEDSYYGLYSYKDFCMTESGRGFKNEADRRCSWESCVKVRKNVERLFGADIDKIDKERSQL